MTGDRRDLRSAWGVAVVKLTREQPLLVTRALLVVDIAQLRIEIGLVSWRQHNFDGHTRVFEFARVDVIRGPEAAGNRGQARASRDGRSGFGAA